MVDDTSLTSENGIVAEGLINYALMEDPYVYWIMIVP